MPVSARDFGHQRDHVGLRDGLSAADRQRTIVIGVFGQFAGDEALALDSAHRGEHARILDAALLELFGDHLIAGMCQIHPHRANYTPCAGQFHAAGWDSSAGLPSPSRLTAQ